MYLLYFRVSAIDESDLQLEKCILLEASLKNCRRMLYRKDLYNGKAFKNRRSSENVGMRRPKPYVGINIVFLNKLVF